MAYAAIADRDHTHPLHEPQSFLTKYIWSQDHKVIAIQYTITAIAIGCVALTLSVLMRLQLGFPHSFSLIAPQNYYQFITLHGMIMVIYLLTALFLGGFGNFTPAGAVSLRVFKGRFATANLQVGRRPRTDERQNH